MTSMLKELVKSLHAPREVAAMFKLKFGGARYGVRKVPKGSLQQLAHDLSNVDFCYAVLHKVSRSFAVVIQQLPEELKDAVCIFYLVLRGLDSIEDDMDITLDVKVPYLRAFHDHIFVDGWSVKGMGDTPDYKCLLENFTKVTPVLKGLKQEYQDTIKRITKEMGDGMAEFAERVTVSTHQDYDLYCHYVAGLVGIGLSELFAASGLEDASIASEKNMAISNSMGLFLQKTNIIRDYLEDLVDGRIWWPDEVWSLYSPTLAALRDEPSSLQSRACLNHMVMDALGHVKDCLAYMKALKQKHVFMFCAIPQVMAIATLGQVYNNPAVFERVVKVRKGLSCLMMIETDSLAKVQQVFSDQVALIQARIPADDPNAKGTHKVCNDIQRLCGRSGKGAQAPRRYRKRTAFTMLLQLCMVWYLFLRFSPRSLDALVSPVRIYGASAASYLPPALLGAGTQAAAAAVSTARAASAAAAAQWHACVAYGQASVEMLPPAVQSSAQLAFASFVSLVTFLVSFSPAQAQLPKDVDLTLDLAAMATLLLSTMYLLRSGPKYDRG